MSRDEALARFADSRQMLLKAIESVGEKDIVQTPVEGVWTIKDVLGHLASWEAICLEPLARGVEGHPIECAAVADYMAWNDEQAASKCALPLGDILAEYSSTRQTVVSLVEKLPAAQWEQPCSFPWGGVGSVADLLQGFYEHELEHVEAIERWKAEQ